MFTFTLLFYGISRKPFVSSAIVVSLVLIFGYITITKYGFRGVPLLPEDFQLSSQAGTLMKFVDTGDIIRLIIAVILTLVLGGILDHLTRKWWQSEKNPKDPWWKKCHIVSRVVIVVVAICGFMISTDFVRNHPSEPVYKVDFLNTEFVEWSQLINYNKNGFLLGFLYNFGTLDISAPADYDKAAIDDIRSELQTTAQETNTVQSRVSLKDGDYNIIVVLYESFFDPEVIREYYNYDGGDVTPNLHRLQNELLSGTMFSPEYGGGTANVEYEVVTGLSNYWLNTVPYTNLLTKQERIPSIASFAAENGMETSVIHPFNKEVYGRDKILPKLGFEKFETAPEFKHTEKDGKSDYINDRSAFAEALDALSSSDNRQLISLITMQNHAPYTFEEYGEPKFRVTNIENENEKNAVETYLMTINKSDEYLGEFVNKVQKFDEPTVVLIYGDHSPGIFKRVLGNQNQDISRLIRETPYLIFSNFNFDNVAAERVLDANGDLPKTTPNCLSNTLFNLLNVEKPLPFYLDDYVCKETPTLSNSYYGVTSPDMTDALKAYQLLSYDLAAGKQYFLQD